MSLTSDELDFTMIKSICVSAFAVMKKSHPLPFPIPQPMFPTAMLAPSQLAVKKVDLSPKLEGLPFPESPGKRQPRTTTQRPVLIPPIGQNHQHPRAFQPDTAIVEDNHRIQRDQTGNIALPRTDKHKALTPTQDGSRSGHCEAPCSSEFDGRF